ncbi:Hypothetical protein A7982_04967 [Minicystis rosea]|nr:Hypothetical protein A7982_04967 [Minicystis rosea]
MKHLCLSLSILTLTLAGCSGGDPHGNTTSSTSSSASASSSGSTSSSAGTGGTGTGGAGGGGSGGMGGTGGAIDQAFCAAMELVELSNPEISTDGATWAPGKAALLTVTATSPQDNTFYVGMNVHHETPGVTPADTTVHTSQVLFAGTPLPIPATFMADTNVAPGTKVSFHITVAPGEDCPGIHSIDFETTIE